MIQSIFKTLLKVSSVAVIAVVVQHNAFAKTCKGGECPDSASTKSTSKVYESACVCYPPMSGGQPVIEATSFCGKPSTPSYCSLVGGVTHAAMCALATEKAKAANAGCSGDCKDDNGDAYAACFPMGWNEQWSAPNGKDCTVTVHATCDCD